MGPEDPITYEWSQTSNPLTEAISGYDAISVPYTGQYWGGLEPGNNALMDGSVNHNNWYYAVGSFILWQGGFPSYAKTNNDNNYPQQSVELYVRREVREIWTAISESLACETNDEGIWRTFGEGGFNLETCKARCLETAGCKAIDYYRESGWCNLYDNACSTPRSSHAGASSWSVRINHVRAFYEDAGSKQCESLLNDWCVQNTPYKYARFDVGWNMPNTKRWRCYSSGALTEDTYSADVAAMSVPGNMCQGGGAGIPEPNEAT